MGVVSVMGVACAAGAAVALAALLVVFAATSDVPDVPRGRGTGCGVQAALDAHNRLRERHSRRPLAWDDALARSAQAKSDTCVFEHTGAALGGVRLGENLSIGTDFETYKCAEAVTAMYADEPKPQGSAGPLPDGAFNHATQILWPAATKVGCGVTRCRDWNLIACHYDVIQGR